MKLALVTLAFLTLSVPAFAQEAVCLAPARTLADDMANAIAHGFQYLGPRRMPFSDNEAVFYVRDGEVYVSMQKEGCVGSQAHPVGPYLPERGI